MKNNLGYIIQDLTFKDEPVYIGANDFNVCKISAARIFIDKVYAERYLREYCMMKRKLKGNTFSPKYQIEEFAIIPVIVMPVENEILDALKNLTGILDTPIGRRKMGEDTMATDAIREARNIINKYKAC